MSTATDKRFYREGRRVLDREKSSHGNLYCEARSGHAADIIQMALNSWHAMGPTRTLPKWVKKRIVKRKAKQRAQEKPYEFDYGYDPMDRL